MRPTAILRTGLVLAFALLLPSWDRAEAQSRIPGLFTTLEEVEPALRRANTREELVSVLRRWAVCTSEPELAERMQREDIRVQVVPLPRARAAIFSGDCDLHLSGQAAGAVFEALSPGDDVIPEADRTGPAIRLRQREFTATSGNAEILAGIADPSGVAAAELESWDGVRRMSPVSGNNIYGAEYRLPPHYRPERLVVRARDRLGNQSEEMVILRRLPFCGSSDGITRDLVRRVQEDLNAIGRDAGLVDGFAGQQTCQALAEHDIAGPFDWGKVAEQLAFDRIGLDAPGQMRVAQPRAIVPVKVLDPRDTRAVWRVQMLRGGLVAASKPPARGEVSFEVTLVQGARETVTFRAVDARSRVLATARTTISRAADIRLRLSGEDFVDGVLTSPDSRATLKAEITGISSGRIEFAGASGRSSAIYRGTPVSFDLAMPPPGETSVVSFAALDEQRETQHTVEVKLYRVPVQMSVTPSPTFEADEDDVTMRVSIKGARTGSRIELRGQGGQALSSTTYREGQTWTTRIPMPAAGQREIVTVAAFDTLGGPLGQPVQVTLIRPGTALPPWAIPVGLGAILLFGILGGLRGLFRRRRHRKPAEEAPPEHPVEPTAKPPIKVTVEPDPTPEIEGPETALPAITLRVETGTTTGPEIILEDEEEPDRDE